MKSNSTNIKRLFLFPHYICNNQCRICFLKNENKSARYSLNEMKSIIDSSFDHNFVSIGGGEPFLYTDLVELIEYCNLKKKVDTQIFSNGTLIKKEKCIELNRVGLDSLILTFHSDNSHGHDYLTRYSGSFELLKNGVREAQEAGIRFITAQIIITTLNYTILQNIVKYCHSLGISKFSIQNFIPSEETKNLSIPLSQCCDYLDKCFDYLNENNLIWYSNSIPHCCVREKFWNNLISLADKHEFTNLNKEKKHNSGHLKEYGLNVPSICKNKCVSFDICCGSWKSYWDLHLKNLDRKEVI